MCPKFKLIILLCMAAFFPAKADVVNETVTIGTGVLANADYGFGENNQYFYSQQLITAAEMKNRACTITDIAFQVYSTTGTSTSELEVYMCETEKSSFTQSIDRIALADLTQVYSNNSISLGNRIDGLQTIHLTNEFSYSGSKNLVIAIRSKKSTTVTVEYRRAKKSGRYLRGTNSTYYSSFNAMSPVDYAPNILISTRYKQCGLTHNFTSNNYSENGFGICDDCDNEIKTQFQPYELNDGGTAYLIQNTGNLMYLAQEQNAGRISESKDYYLTGDINLAGLTWTAIGNNDHPFSGNLYGPCDITGLANDDYLVNEYNGTIKYIHLTNGRFINKGLSNCIIRYSFTEGDMICNSGNCAITYSYCINDDSNKRGACTAAQLNSGEIAFYLNGDFRNYWRQTIGTDNLPSFNSSSKIVYRYSQCEKSNFKFTNTSSLSNTHQDHNFVNSVCNREGCPNNNPTTITGNITLNNNTYLRTKNATVSGTISFSNYYTDEEKGNWQSLCLPFSMEYTSTNAQNYELAELYDYDLSDTNGDGIIDANDDKLFKITKLNIGDVTEANHPYLVRPLVNNITFTANNENLAAVDNTNTEIETDNEVFSISRNYTRNASVATSKMYVMDNALKLPSNATTKIDPFRWIITPQTKGQSTWQGASSIDLKAIYMDYAIEDDGSNPYTINADIEVANFTYNRSITNVGVWQAFYVPFAVNVDEIISMAEVATFMGAVTLPDGETDAIVVEKLEEGVIPAHTPFLLRLREALDVPFCFEMSNIVLPAKPVYDTELYFESDLAHYTITGVYNEYRDIYNTWYAISRSDGQFHKAKVHYDTKLPPYRFYLTISEKNMSSDAPELRFTCMDKEELTTGIQKLNSVNEENDWYTIDGKRVSSIKDILPGLYIQKGKKMIIK